MTDIPSVAALRDKVIAFENAGYYLVCELHEARRLFSLFGPPKPMDFPAHADRRRAMDAKIRAALAAAGGDCPALPTSAWSEFLEGFTAVFQRFHTLSEGVLVASDSQEFVVDSCDTPVTQRLIPKLNASVRLVRSHVHPGAFGDDGLGFFRSPTMIIPERFAPELEDVVALRVLLEAAKQPPPLRRANGWSGVDLKRIGGIKDGVFIRMCEKAGVKRPKSGKGVAHRFTKSDVIKLIAVGRASKSPRWNQAADSWGQELNFE